MQQGTGAKWAWLQLGLQYLDQGDATEAIKALQHVIRADPNDKYNNHTLSFNPIIDCSDIFYHKFTPCLVIVGNLWRMHI